MALNAERAEEERRGLVRWLRSEFQNPQGTQHTQTAIETDENDDAESEIAAAPVAVTWPKSLAERMALVRDTVYAQGALTAAELKKRVGAKKPVEVVEVADGLAMLGHLIATGDGTQRRWAVPQKQRTAV